MQQKLHLIDPKIRLNLLVSSFVFALFVLIMLNIIFSIVTINNTLEILDRNGLNPNFTNGYFTLNQERIGFPLLINFCSFFLVWCFLFQCAKKSIIEK